MNERVDDIGRVHRMAPASARDFGLERAYATESDRYSREMTDALAAHLRNRRQFADTFLITAKPRARRPESFAGSLDKLMRTFARWWGRRHAVGQDLEHLEPIWLDYFLVVGRSEANHASHGHVILSADLSAAEQDRLQKLATKRGLALEFTANSDEWLADRPSVGSHASKIDYAVSHLLQRGATWRASESESPEWVRRSRDAFARHRRRESGSRRSGT